MKPNVAALIIFTLLSLTACMESNRGRSQCGTDLTYVTNRFTQGEQATRHASEYQASLTMGSDEFLVNAIIDTASASLVINKKHFDSGFDSVIGKKSFVFDNGYEKAPAVLAKDSVDVACIDNFAARFALAAQESSAENYMGLAYNDPEQHPHEKYTPPFFSQLVAQQGLDDVFSLSLCGTRGRSWVLLGGIDDKMDGLIGNFIPIIEKTAYVVPALTIRRSDNKQVLGTFPTYDPEQKSGTRTIIDSASSFLLLPPDMAERVSKEVEHRADALGLLKQFPAGFFRTERSNSIKAIRFGNETQIRQFPWLEINFLGTDGRNKSLELSPLHYLKEIDTSDPLLRVFAVRETSGDVVLGQPFLENHYTYFDRKNGRLGFGNIDVACSGR
jgi:hypothetical protein